MCLILGLEVKKKFIVRLCYLKSIDETKLHQMFGYTVTSQIHGVKLIAWDGETLEYIIISNAYRMLFDCIDHWNNGVKNEHINKNNE